MFTLKWWMWSPATKFHLLVHLRGLRLMTNSFVFLNRLDTNTSFNVMKQNREKCFVLMFKHICVHVHARQYTIYEPHLPE